MKNARTEKFKAPGAKTPDEVNQAVADALKDKSFAADVEDRRIMWTVDGDTVTAYFRVAS